MKLVDLVPLKEGSMQARELADRNSLQQLQSMYDQLLRDMEQEAEPEGGPIADQYADQIQDIEDAIRLAKGDSGGEMTYDDMIKKHYGKSPTGVLPSGKPKFEKSSEFKKAGERSGFDMRGLNESEKSWNAVDVSRTAEKEIDNKEWNERTAKKLAILKALNAAGKFKKDWDEEKLQDWVDQNYSWEKLSQQFKLNESYSAMYEQGTIKKVVNLKMDSEVGEPVTVEYAPGSNLTNVTISWGNESHTVDFEAGDVIDDHGNEGMDIETMADSDDGRWQFILDVQVEASFPMTGDFADWDFDELIVQGHPDNEDHLDPEDRSDYQNEDFELEPEDLDNPDEDLVIIGSGYLDIKNKFKGRPNMTNGELATLGQKVVDQLHNGDQEAAFDYIMSKINEGSCGYTQKAIGGEKLKTPGGTKGMKADTRTMTMMRETIRKEIKKLHENK